MTETPILVNGYPCKTAEVIGNDKRTFPLKNLASMRDFSHEFTGPLKSDTLGNWAIFYSGFAKREFSSFVSELQNSVKNDF